MESTEPTLAELLEWQGSLEVQELALSEARKALEEMSHDNSKRSTKLQSRFAKRSEAELPMARGRNGDTNDRPGGLG